MKNLDELTDKIYHHTSEFIRGNWSQVLIQTKDKHMFEIDFTKNDNKYMVWRILHNGREVTAYDVNMLEMELNKY